MHRRPGTLALATSPHAALRSIRTQIPPRPGVTVIAYLDHYGNPIKTKEETDLSLIRTRDNKFFLQRVFADESIVRFPAPGLGMIKSGANLEYFSLNEIDIYGGIIIPSDVAPTPHTERPGFHDAVQIMMQCSPTTKFTRKDRRAWHRRIYANWEEHPEKYQVASLHNGMLALVVAVFCLLKYNSWKRENDPLTGTGYRIEEDEGMWKRAKNFGKRHPEHSYNISASVDFSPAQLDYIYSRAEPTYSDHDSSVGMEFFWKLRHAKSHGHWPKGLRE